MDNAAGYLRVEPRLLEEATFHALRRLPDTLAHDRERVGLYSIGDPEERERRFRALYASWFVRHAVLWRLSVEGRLARRGLAEPGARERHRGEFERHFPALGKRTEEIFERLFNDDAPTHARLAEPAAGGPP